MSLALGVTGEGGIALLTIFILSVFVGFEVISKVSSILHTPLMSGANAIHGIILIGSMLILGFGHGSASLVLGVLAVILATVNAVGGFVVTDRMLEMFKGRARAPAAPPAAAGAPGSPDAGPSGGSGRG